MRRALLPLLAIPAMALGAAEAGARNLMAVAIAKSDDHVYYWYSDNGGEVSAGLTNDPFRYRGLQPFQTPVGGWNVVAVAINSEDRVYYWLQNGTTINVSIGTSQDPFAYGGSGNFAEPPGEYILQEAGISTADRVYYYWRHRESHTIYNSVGTSTNPVAYENFRPLQGAIFMQSYDLRHVDIASDDHVYYFWERLSDGELVVTAGTSLDPFAYRDVYSANQPD